MHLKIYTMRRTVYEGETARVTLPTAVGEVTILDNHEPYVTILRPGDLRFDVPVSHDLPSLPASGGRESTAEVKGAITHGENKLAIKGGFLEVREGNELRVLADE